VQADTLGEVGILGTVLLRVYSGTLFPIFIEIGSYLTDKEPKISWHSFFWDTVYLYNSILCTVLLCCAGTRKLSRINSCFSGTTSVSRHVSRDQCSDIWWFCCTCKTILVWLSLFVIIDYWVTLVHRTNGLYRTLTLTLTLVRYPGSPLVHPI